MRASARHARAPSKRHDAQEHKHTSPPHMACSLFEHSVQPSPGGRGKGDFRPNQPPRVNARPPLLRYPGSYSVHVPRASAPPPRGIPRSITTSGCSLRYHVARPEADSHVLRDLCTVHSDTHTIYRVEPSSQVSCATSGSPTMWENMLARAIRARPPAPCTLGGPRRRRHAMQLTKDNYHIVMHHPATM